MKKSILFFIFYFLFNSLYAQLSDRSKPFSFSYNFSDVSNTTTLSKKINLPLFNLDSLKNEDAINDKKKGAYRFGYNHFVSLTTENSGVWTELKNGDKIWQLEISSQNAKTLNFAFSDFKLPQDAKLWLFSSNKQDYIGAFTSDVNSDDGYFATDIVLGSSVVIEYYLPKGVSQKNPFTLFRVTHGYRGFGIKNNDDEKLFGNAGSCNVNINCPSGNNWQDQKRGSAFTLSSGGNEVCSGSLINNALSDGTPYFLTANHCYNAFNNLSLMVFKFNFDAPTCNYVGSTPSHNALTGASLVAKNAASDFCLLLLKDNLPASYNLFLAGWNRSTTVNDTIVCIHHPAGDVTKISFAPRVTPATYSGAQCWKTGVWGDIDGDDISDTGGVTEGGSSGSPIFDENKRIIGQLYGGSSSCSATGLSRTDYYGRIDASWGNGSTPQTRLADWLDPCSSGTMGINGIFANSPASYTNEAKFISVLSPADNSSICNASSLTPIIRVKNNGQTTISSISVSYSIDGASNTNTIINKTINVGATENVTIPEIQNIATGSHVISFTVTQVNGVADEFACNNSGSANFTVLDLSSITLTSFVENFETGTFPPNDFSLKNEDSGSVTWEQNNTNGGYGTSSKSMKMNFWTGANGQIDYFYSPFFSLIEKDSVQLFFDLANKRYSASNDSLIVSISENCGITWDDIYKKGGASLATTGSSFSQYITTSASDWRTDTIKLNNYRDLNTLQIRFKAKSANGNNLYIDNINLASKDITTSNKIKENNAQTILIFPNPVISKLNISLNNIAINQISIYSSIGTLVKDFGSNINNSSFSADVNSLSKGLYFIKLSDAKNNLHYSKFIKN